MKSDRSKRKAGLLGIGLDNDDGHVRVTRGENFQLLGGSEETHGRMQDQCIRFDEKLREKGKPLEHLEQQEIIDIAGECEMNLLLPRSKEQ